MLGTPVLGSGDASGSHPPSPDLCSKMTCSLMRSSQSFSLCYTFSQRAFAAPSLHLRHMYTCTLETRFGLGRWVKRAPQRSPFAKELSDGPMYWTTTVDGLLRETILTAVRSLPLSPVSLQLKDEAIMSP